MKQEALQSKEMPTRFHIGMQRSGSTYLYHLLSSHPDISLSKYQEINYYSMQYEKGKQWYLQSFYPGKYMIDTSPKYFLQGDLCAKKISQAVGKQAKLLIVLRNPIDYLFSHFQFHLVRGYFKKRTDLYPKGCPEDIVDFLKLYPEYIDRSKYFHNLETNWLKHFSKKQIKIIFFEEFVSHNATHKEILDFFKIPNKPLKSKNFSVNINLKNSKLYTVQKFIARRKRLKEYLMKNKLANYLYRRFFHRSAKLDPKTRVQLKKLLESDVKQLVKEFNLDKNIWKDFSR